MSLRYPEPFVCQKCGSSHYYEADYQQYLQHYSATPGGDIIRAEGYPMPVRVCLCGEPQEDPRWLLRQSEWVKAFQDSLEKARKHRADLAPEGTLKALMESFVLKADFDALLEKTNRLQTAVAILRQEEEPK